MFIRNQLILGLEVIHCNKLIHRDLKPENVMLDKNLSVKTCDFGCTKELDTTSQKASTVIGTPFYESPEVQGVKYDASSDMWALGMLFIETSIHLSTLLLQENTNLFRVRTVPKRLR